MTTLIPEEQPKIPGRPVKYNPTLRERIIDIIQRELGEENVLAESRFVEDLGADSLDMVEMAMVLEEEFELPEIDDELVDKFVFVEDVMKYVEKRVKQ